MVILAVAIDIGSDAINRDGFYGVYTVVNGLNPANASGKINQLEVYANAAMSDVEVATFYVVSGNNLSTRDTQAIGSLSLGYNSFNVDLNVEEGDYIGIYYTAGNIDTTNSGGSNWYGSEDNIPCTDHAFYASSRIVSIGGTGATVGWDHKWNTLTIGKWNTKEFTKWNGLE